MKLFQRILFFLTSICFIKNYIAIAGEEKYLDTITREIYSANTTLYTTLHNIKYNQNGYNTVSDNIDISQVHRFSTLYKNYNALQNLGLNGTAAKYLYFIFPNEIGVDSGYHVYDIYFPSIQDFKYYDTKSPYVDLIVTLARYGSFYGDVCFSRNVNENWNLGANMHLMISQKEFLENSSLDSSDRAVISNGVELFSSFKTTSEVYKLYTSIVFMKHRIREPGGIYVLPLSLNATIKENKFLDLQEASRNRLSISNRIYDLYPHYKSDPATVDVRKIIHLYHQLELTTNLWIYHEVEIGSLSNYFEYRNRESDDKSKKANRETPPETLANLDSVTEIRFLSNKMALGYGDKDNLLQDLITFHDSVYMQNEIGIKNKWNDLFYMPYYKLKNSKHNKSHGKLINDSLGEDYRNRKYNEHSLGIYSRYNFNFFANDYVEIRGEYLFGGMYKSHIGYGNNIFAIDIDRCKYSPSLLSQDYNYKLSNRMWKNDFYSPTATRAKGSAIYSTKWIDLIPNITVTWLNNPICFKQKKISKEFDETYAKKMYNEASTEEEKEMINKLAKIAADKNPSPIAEPYQLNGKVCISTIGTDANLKFGPIRLYSTVIIANELGTRTNFIRFPTLLANAMLFYTRTNKAGNGSIDSGIDVHFKSEYTADGYDPVIQQFFTQESFKVYAYPVIDLFLNFRVNAFNMFIKWSHINEFIYASKGYFATPFYPGQSMALDIGIKWSFFD